VQIERLRKEGSRLVAEEQEKLEQQIREESSQLYNDGDTGVRLRVRTVFLTAAITDSNSPSAEYTDLHNLRYYIIGFIIE